MREDTTMLRMGSWSCNTRALVTKSTQEDLVPFYDPPGGRSMLRPKFKACISTGASPKSWPNSPMLLNQSEYGFTFLSTLVLLEELLDHGWTTGLLSILLLLADMLRSLNVKELRIDDLPFFSRVNFDALVLEESSGILLLVFLLLSRRSSG